MPLFCGRNPTALPAGALPFSNEFDRSGEPILVVLVGELEDRRVRLLVDDSLTIEPGVREAVDEMFMYAGYSWGNAIATYSMEAKLAKYSAKW
jgi:hypothetical protein